MIRPATLIDIPRMLDLAERFHQESSLAYVPFDRAKVADVILSLIDYRRGLALVSVRRGEVIGGFLGVAEEHIFSRALFSMDLCTFIAPEYRGGFSGPALVRAYIRWARSIGVACINGGVASGIDQERGIRIFKKLGFVPTGICFVWEGK